MLYYYNGNQRVSYILYTKAIVMYGPPSIKPKRVFKNHVLARIDLEERTKHLSRTLVKKNRIPPV